MSCGCGKSCCQERTPLLPVAGLGFLYSSEYESGGGYDTFDGRYWDWWYGDGYNGGGGFFDDYSDLTDAEFDYLCSLYGGCYDPAQTVDRQEIWAPYNLPPGSTYNGPYYSPVPPYTDWQPNFGGGAAPQAPYPGYCPSGTYHPLNNPYACVPFPPDDAQQNNRNVRPRPSQSAITPPRVSPSNPQKCPPGIVNDPKTGRCVCPKGLIFDARSGRCVQATLANRLTAPGPGGLPWWLILLGGVLVLKAAKGDGGRRR